MKTYVSKGDVVSEINQLYDAKIREAIDKWTDQSFEQLLDWMRGHKLICTNMSNEQIISAFKHQ